MVDCVETFRLTNEIVRTLKKRGFKFSESWSVFIENDTVFDKPHTLQNTKLRGRMYFSIDNKREPIDINELGAELLTNILEFCLYGNTVFDLIASEHNKKYYKAELISK